MAKKNNHPCASLSIYQLMENFDLTEANLEAFVSNKTKLTESLIIQVDKVNQKTTWIMLGANTNPVLLHKNIS